MSKLDVTEMYEKYIIDEAEFRLEEWITDDKRLNDVEAALLDYKTEVLEPTGVELLDWTKWDKARKHNFLDWLESKDDDPYGWIRWRERAFDRFYDEETRWKTR